MKEKNKELKKKDREMQEMKSIERDLQQQLIEKYQDLIVM